MTAETFTFVCAKCGEGFISDRPMEQVVAESFEQFGPLEEADRAYVCTDCYEAFLAWLEATP